MFVINEASWDRIARVIVGIALLAVGWSGLDEGNWAVFLKVIGWVPVATGLIGWCPAYTVCHFSTK